MKLQFSGFNKAKIEASSKAWIEDANNGLGFPPEIERHFKWVETHTEPSDVDSMAFGVFGENKNVALGICEITIQRKSVRSKWVKMLRLHLKPSVDEALRSGDSDLAMQVFTQCMIGTMDLQLAHKANTLKIYGRTPQQLAFLKVLASHIDKHSTTKASIEGRFLSINFN